MQPGSSIIQCTCGAAYERHERQLPIKDIGLFACDECGARIEIWSGRTVPVFKRVALQATEKRSA
jgi:hypothetical protein